MTTSVDTQTRNTELALRFIDVMDRQQFDEVETMMSPDFHLYFSGLSLDKAQTMALIRGVYVSFADFKHEIQDAFAADDRVVLRIVDRATHTGDFEGIAPTGRTISVGQISIVRVAGDLITEIREEADMLGLMQQLGAIPTTVS